MSSNQETNRDKVLRREVVKVADSRLSEMQAQAISGEGVSENEYHWHWAAIVNELIARRADETTALRWRVIGTEPRDVPVLCYWAPKFDGGPYAIGDAVHSGIGDGWHKPGNIRVDFNTPTFWLPMPALPGSLEEPKCQHDLLKPDTTIEVIDPWKAKCKVCVEFFDLPGRPEKAEEPSEPLPDETGLRPGELRQLRKIDAAARFYIDSVKPGRGLAWENLMNALFDGRPEKATADLPACECLVRNKTPSAYHNIKCPRYVADLL